MHCKAGPPHFDACEMDEAAEMSPSQVCGLMALSFAVSINV